MLRFAPLRPIRPRSSPGALARPTRLGAVAATVALAVLAVAPAASAVEGETFAITEVDFGARTIAITNHGDTEVDPSGLVVCSFPSYAPVPNSSPLAPGASLVVDLDAIGIPADAADGELGLYLNSRFEDPAAIVAYLEWGSEGHARSSVAASGEVGGTQVWTGGAVDPAGGSVLTATVPFPNSPAHWSADSGAALPRTGVSLWAIAMGGLALLALGGLLLRGDRRRVRS